MPRDSKGSSPTLFASRYRIESEIASGGSAVVYLAFDEAANQSVALKLRHDVANVHERKRFLREIRLAGELTHPNILPLLDAGEADGQLYLVLPYIAGGTLRDRIQRVKQLSFDETCALARAVGAALQFAHEHGVVHRDVKPANILLDGDKPYLADFGVARVAPASPDESSTSTGIVVGTVAYMSPEQASGEHELDARTDVYALACTLYECITGMPAFAGPTLQSILVQHMGTPPRDVRVYRPSASRALSRVLNKALSTTPADRYQSVSEFVDAFESAAQQSEVRRWYMTPVARSGIAALALTVVVAAALVANNARRRDPAADGPVDDRSLVRIAVAPFRVFGGDTIWSSGLTEVLSRNVDGAGAVRAVPPGVAAKAWRDDASNDGARAYGERLHADFVVNGSLMRSADSVRATAWLTDVMSARMVSIEVRDDSARMDRVIDSLTVRLLREMGRTRAIGAVRGQSFGARSIPALREFLEGEREYRLNRAEAAMSHYQAALALDSTFALAYRRMRSVLRATVSETDPTSFRYALEAGRRNRNLGVRDSLLVLADSLAASRARRTGVAIVDDAETHRELARRFEALELAVRHYPTDAEVWYELAEAQHHFGYFFGYSARTALESFERAIASDSGYRPAYFHAIELGFEYRGPDATAGLIGAYLQRRPDDGRFVVVRAVLAALARGDAIDARVLARYSLRDVKEAAYVLRRAQDLPHPAELLWRWVADAADGDRAMRDEARGWIFHYLVFTGRLREAAAMATPAQLSSVPLTTLFLAEMNALSTARSDSIFQGWAASTWSAVMATLPWWARRGDGARVDSVASRARVALNAATSSGRERALAQYVQSAAAMYRALASGDSTAALQHSRALADSLCSWVCLSDRLVTARLTALAGDADAAAALLDRHPPSAAPFTVAEVQWHLMRAHLDEQRARTARSGAARRALRDAAAAHVAFVRRVWLNADPPVRALLEARGNALAATER